MKKSKTDGGRGKKKNEDSEKEKWNFRRKNIMR